jgi:hypothetical protein
MVIPSHDVVVVRMGPSPGGSQDYLSQLVVKILDGLPKVKAGSQGNGA